MSRSRFYLEPDQWTGGGSLRLSGDEAHHCARVMRLREGDEVEVFDGAGKVALARIATTQREEVTLTVESQSLQEPLPYAVHLLPALIKGEAFEWLLEKAVELGAASVSPVFTARTVARWDAEQAEKKLVKWRRHMLEAAKQCHTPFLPELRAPAPLREVLAGGYYPQGDILRLVPALFGPTLPLTQALSDWGTGARQAVILTGPEGDLTEHELAAILSAGFQPVTLGPLILRAETAAVTTLATVAQIWLDGWTGRQPD